MEKTWIYKRRQAQLESSSSTVSKEGTRQLGYLNGRVVKGLSSSDSPRIAKPNVYPRARATGTATAFPTWVYLHWN